MEGMIQSQGSKGSKGQWMYQLSLSACVSPARLVSVGWFLQEKGASVDQCVSVLSLLNHGLLEGTDHPHRYTIPRSLLREWACGGFS